MELKTNLNSAHKLVRVSERQINQGKHSQAIQTEKEVVKLLRYEDFLMCLKRYFN